MPGAEDSLRYAVVVNDEEQYSIWRAGRDLPAGLLVVAHPATQ